MKSADVNGEGWLYLQDFFQFVNGEEGTAWASGFARAHVFYEILPPDPE
jgi:hypothetical protein